MFCHIGLYIFDLVSANFEESRRQCFQPSSSSFSLQFRSVLDQEREHLSGVPGPQSSVRIFTRHYCNMLWYILQYFQFGVGHLGGKSFAKCRLSTTPLGSIGRWLFSRLVPFCSLSCSHFTSLYCFCLIFLFRRCLSRQCVTWISDPRNLNSKTSRVLSCSAKVLDSQFEIKICRFIMPYFIFKDILNLVSAIVEETRRQPSRRFSPTSRDLTSLPQKYHIVSLFSD